MSFKSEVFASARVKSKENKLIGTERLNRMLECENAEDVLKILFETSYAEGVSISDPNDYQLMLDAEQNNLNVFFKEVCPDENILTCFFKKYDYHNAKAFVKAKYQKLDNADFMIYQKGLIDYKLLNDNILNENYTFLPPFMTVALNKIDVAYASYGANPRQWDMYLDNALNNDIISEIKKLKEADVKNYFILKTDIENLLSLVKCIMTNLTAKDYEKQFIEGGKLDISVFVSSFGLSLENAAEQFKHTYIYSLAFTAFKNLEKEGITPLETEADNMLNYYFFAKRNKYESIYPLLNYYLIKIAELKNVKLIFTGIIGGATKTELKKRLRR